MPQTPAQPGLRHNPLGTVGHRINIGCAQRYLAYWSSAVRALSCEPGGLGAGASIREPFWKQPVGTNVRTYAELSLIFRHSIEPCP